MQTLVTNGLYLRQHAVQSCAAPSCLSRGQFYRTSTSRPPASSLVANPALPRRMQASGLAAPCRHAAQVGRRRAAAVSAGMTLDTLAEPFLWANSGLTYAWCLLIVAPRWQVTKAIFQSEAAVILPCLLFVYFIVAATQIDISSPEQLNEKTIFLFTEAVKDPRLMMTIVTPAYIAQDWLHVLVWDFIVGRYIWMEALEKNLPVRFSLFTIFTLGPIGLIVHVITKSVVGVLRQQQQPQEASSDKPAP